MFTPAVDNSKTTGTESVRRMFESSAIYWKEIYGKSDVYSVIHQERRARVLRSLDRLCLPARSKILEVGCGMGSMTVALAKRGFSVTAIDVAARMVAATASEAEQAGVRNLVEASEADLHNMPFANASFTVVLAVGVLPWVASFGKPLMEMARVLRPGGYLIVTADNRHRLSHVLHPREWPRLLAINSNRANASGIPSEEPVPKTCSIRAFDAVLSAAGFQDGVGETLGFGPFCLFDKFLSNRVQVSLHHALQYFSDRKVPVVRAAGSHYIVICRKAV